MMISLPWYSAAAGREERADSVFGRYRIVGHTLPPWHKVSPHGPLVGYTIYSGDKRIGWTLRAEDAQQTAEGFAGGEYINRVSAGRYAV